MKDIGEGTIRRIDWTELTPVVLLLRVFNVSLGLRVLAIAMIGACLTVGLGEVLHIPLQDGSRSSTELFGDARIDWCGTTLGDRRYNLWSYDGNPIFPLAAMYIMFSDEFIPLLFSLFTLKLPSDSFLWLPGIVLIWVFCGGMICRIVALRLTVDESESTSNLLLFFRKRGIGFISSLIILSLGILCCFLPVLIACWLAAVPGLNYVVAILLPIPLLFAFFTVILALGLAVGWMLLFAAVSTDGSDGFDAISRMFSYIFQRPLHYLFYWFCSGILGWLGYMLMVIICDLVFFMFGLGLGFPSIVLETFWLDLFRLLPTAYVFAWFWTSSVAIYLLLRRSVDATPFIEVYRVEPPKVRTLPTIKPDEHGAPEIKQAEPQT